MPAVKFEIFQKMGKFFENSKKGKEMSAASSTSLSGGNQVDGLPPAIIDEICEKTIEMLDYINISI